VTLRCIGIAKNQFWAHMTAAAFNLLRMVQLERALAPA
jgi:hypothetical protein